MPWQRLSHLEASRLGLSSLFSRLDTSILLRGFKRFENFGERSVGGSSEKESTQNCSGAHIANYTDRCNRYYISLLNITLAIRAEKGDRKATVYLYNGRFQLWNKPHSPVYEP